MASFKRCECCATESDVLVDMKKERFAGNSQATYYTMFRKFLKLFDDENIIYAGNENPMICCHCAQQLEASFTFLTTCRQTILAAQVVVKQEPGLNFTGMLSTTAHAFIPIKEEPDDSSLLIPGTVQETGRKSKTTTVADPDYIPMEVKEEDFEDNDEYCDNDYDSDLKSDNFECQICSKAFLTKAGLNSHRRIHEAVLADLLECTVCGFKLPQTSIDAHMLTHSADNPWEFVEMCPENGCNRKFKLKSELDCHLVHHTSAEFVCYICQKRYSSKKNLREHEKLHGERNYHCSLCTRSFTEQRRLNEHMKVHRERAMEKFECPVCGKLFSTRNNLREHEKLHGERNFHCTECNGKFTEQRRLNEHMKIHGERNFPCDQCEKAFTTQCRLNEHLKYHSVGKQFACEHCDEVFRLQNSLQKHVRRNHDTAYAFHCKHCGKGFIMQSDCNAHEECHSNELNHTCSECNKQFNTLKNLRNHMAVHFVEKTIACPAQGCSKMFRNQRDCRRHNETVHEKLWRCEICSRCCSSDGQLKKHIQNVHTDSFAIGEDKKQRRLAIEAMEKPLVCGYQGCKIRFQDEHRLAIHRLRHNNVGQQLNATNFVITDVENSRSEDSSNSMVETVKQEPVANQVYPMSMYTAAPPMQNAINTYDYNVQGYEEEELDHHVANRLRALEELQHFQTGRTTSRQAFDNMMMMGHEASNMTAMTVIHYNPQ